VEITEVRIKLMDDPHDRLQGFCSITFDSCFVIRDLKIIQGAKGPFVAMPSRKLTDRCPKCNTKNHLRALYCNQCGSSLMEDRAIKDSDGRAKLYADIAHPINSDCRELIQKRVLEAFSGERVRAKQPGYVCTYDDYGEDRYATLAEPEEPETVIVTGRDDTAHRIEPSAHEPGPPHHAVTSPQRDRQTVGAMVERPVRKDSDPFGAGIE
jgi:stage V sporulation protein G